MYIRRIPVPPFANSTTKPSPHQMLENAKNRNPIHDAVDSYIISPSVPKILLCPAGRRRYNRARWYLMVPCTLFLHQSTRRFMHASCNACTIRDSCMRGMRGRAVSDSTSFGRRCSSNLLLGRMRLGPRSGLAECGGGWLPRFSRQCQCLIDALHILLFLYYSLSRLLQGPSLTSFISIWLRIMQLLLVPLNIPSLRIGLFSMALPE